MKKKNYNVLEILKYKTLAIIPFNNGIIKLIFLVNTSFLGINELKTFDT